MKTLEEIRKAVEADTEGRWTAQAVLTALEASTPPDVAELSQRLEGYVECCPPGFEKQHHADMLRAATALRLLVNNEPCRRRAISSELVERLRERAESYRKGGPSSNTICSLEARLEVLEALIEAQKHSDVVARTAKLLYEKDDRIEALEAENARLREALREAAETLEWASRRMKGNCSGADVNAVILAARRAREGGNADG